MLMSRRCIEDHMPFVRSGWMCCCPCMFRKLKQNSVSPETWGTPVLAVTILPNDVNIVTKSSATSYYNADQVSLSQDSGISQQISSGSESSDFYSPPSELHSSTKREHINTINKQSPYNISFDQTDQVPTAAHKRERFINIEESLSSEFEDQDSKKSVEDLQDEQEVLRSQVFSRLAEKHIGNNPAEDNIANKVPEKRLSKSHADLSQRKNVNRKSISSAPLVKQSKRSDRKLPHENVVQVVNEYKLKQSYSPAKEVHQAARRSEQLNVNDNFEVNQNFIEVQSDVQGQKENYTKPETPSNYYTSIENNNISSRAQTNIEDDLKPLDIRNQNFMQDQKKVEHVKCPAIVKRTPVAASKEKPELRRKSSSIPMKIPTIFPDSLRNFPKPKEGYSEMVHQLESPEWETIMRGLQSLVRLVRHHPDILETQMHTVCVLLGRHIKNLRSQVARAACLTVTEMFHKHFKTMETELEEVANPLLQRTADTNKFLRADANAALDSMCNCVSVTRAISVLGTRGATHHNAIVRCATARLLLVVVRRLTPQRVFELPKEARDRILSIGANFLTEGNLDTRKHAKSMFSELVNHPHFQRALKEAAPASTIRHISKIINNLK